MEITINKTTHDIAEIIDDIEKINKIVNNNCSYCKSNNIRSNKSKLKIIKKILNKYEVGKWQTQQTFITA